MRGGAVAVLLNAEMGGVDNVMVGDGHGLGGDGWRRLGAGGGQLRPGSARAWLPRRPVRAPVMLGAVVACRHALREVVTVDHAGAGWGFGLSVPVQTIEAHGPTKSSSKTLGKRWRDLFAAKRAEFRSRGASSTPASAGTRTVRCASSFHADMGGLASALLRRNPAIRQELRAGHPEAAVGAYRRR
jgi:hypothetical protein